MFTIITIEYDKITNISITAYKLLLRKYDSIAIIIARIIPNIIPAIIPNIKTAQPKKKAKTPARSSDCIDMDKISSKNLLIVNLSG